MIGETARNCEVGVKGHPILMTADNRYYISQTNQRQSHFLMGSFRSLLTRLLDETKNHEGLAHSYIWNRQKLFRFEAPSPHFPNISSPQESLCSGSGKVYRFLLPSTVKGRAFVCIPFVFAFSI